MQKSSASPLLPGSWFRHASHVTAICHQRQGAAHLGEFCHFVGTAEFRPFGGTREESAVGRGVGLEQAGVAVQQRCTLPGDVAAALVLPEVCLPARHPHFRHSRVRAPCLRHAKEVEFLVRRTPRPLAVWAARRVGEETHRMKGSPPLTESAPSRFSSCRAVHRRSGSV